MAPYAGAIALMLPLLTAAWLAPVEFHRELGRMVKYMNFGLYTLALAGVFSFAFGAFLAAHTRPAASALAVTHAATSPAVCRLPEAVAWVLFGVALAAYAIWFTPLFAIRRSWSTCLPGAGPSATFGIRSVPFPG